MPTSMLPGSGPGPKPSTSFTPLRTALQLMNEYPDYTYTVSAAAYNQWMEEKYPSQHQQIADRVKEGRWEMVGVCGWNPTLICPMANRSTPVIDREALLQRQIRRRRAHRMESGFVRLQLATAADLQEVRYRLFRNAEDDVERYKQTPLKLSGGNRPMAAAFALISRTTM